MDRIQLRRDTAANWRAHNPILLEGEPGYEIDTKLRKIGDGVNAWNDLPYLAAENVVQELGDDENAVISQAGIANILKNDIFLQELGDRENIGVSQKVVSEKVPYVIKGQGTSISGIGDINVGECYYNTSNKVLRLCVKKNEEFVDVAWNNAVQYVLPSKELGYYNDELNAVVCTKGYIFDSDFFKNKQLLKDVGVCNYILSADDSIVPSLKNRSIWIKVSKGEVFYIKCRQYNDTLCVGFSTTISNQDITHIVDKTDYRTNIEHYVEIEEDGFLFVSWLAYGTPLNIGNGGERLPNDMGCEIQLLQKKMDIDKHTLELLSPLPYYINDNGVAVSTKLSPTSNSTYELPVKKGTVIKFTAYNYSDTAIISFSANQVEVGDKIDNYIVGNYPKVEKKAYIQASQDGYIYVTIYKGVGFTKLVVYNNTLELVEKVINSINNPNIDRRLVEFQSVDNAIAMSSMTANDVIETIYEPLRAKYPEYITRKSLGKDASNTYDIWCYEFNNNVDDWFCHKEGFYGCLKLPNVGGYPSNKVAVKKSVYDNFVADKDYNNVYINSRSVNYLPVKITDIKEVTIDGVDGYEFTCEENIAVITHATYGDGVLFMFTKKLETQDQEVVIVSGTHGDEVAGYMGTALALQYLAENYKDNLSLKYIHDHVKLSVIPILNVWGANQNPRVRTNSLNVNLNRYQTPYTQEQQVLIDYIDGKKDKISVFADFHTSELWNNYGMVYTIVPYPSLLYPLIASTSNWLCKHWFPNLVPCNWNVGSNLGTNIITASDYMRQTYNMDSATIEFCGLDIIAFKGCQRWDATYMKMCVENYLNYLIALCCSQLKNNNIAIYGSEVLNHVTMS